MEIKNWSKFALLVGFIFAACNCGGAATYSKTTAALNDQKKSRQEDRKDDKLFMDYISERTVSVEYDCEPKPNTFILGVFNPSTAADGRGSGSIVKSSEDVSYIYTAAHVVTDDNPIVKKAFDCQVFVLRNDDLNNKSARMKAKIFAVDEDRDIAVLSVEKDLKVSSELEYDPFTGEPVWAAGYPVQLANSDVKILSITEGALATKFVPTDDDTGFQHRVTSQVFFGNSGGGVWNKEGKLIGIVTSLYSDGGPPYEGYYYIKPVNEVRRLLENEWKFLPVFGI